MLTTNICLSSNTEYKEQLFIHDVHIFNMQGI